MDGEQIGVSSVERDIGVIIASNLKPSEMCSAASKKANRCLGLLSRGLSFKTAKNFLPLYSCFVLPHLEFAQASWSPWLQGDKDLLEGVQRRALKQITNLKSRKYEDQLRELGILSIASRCKRNDLILMYKIMNDMEGIDASQFFTLAQREEQLIATRESTGHLSVKRNPARLDTRSKFFTCRVVEPWNSIPSYIRSQPTLKAFIADLDAYIKNEGWI